MRPATTFRSETGRRARDAGLHFLSAPTHAESHISQRNPQFAKWRYEVKNAQTPAKLLEVLQEAESAKQIDSSVVGAGSAALWLPEMVVCSLRRASAPRTTAARWCLGRRLLLSALARCVKDKTLNAAELEARGRKALELGKQTWKSLPGLTSEVAFCSALGSAWDLCDAVSSKESLLWANELLVRNARLYGHGSDLDSASLGP